MGGRRRKQSGKGRRPLRSSDSEESDVIDMNSKSKKSDETNQEEPNKGADSESRIFSCVIVILLTPQDVNVVSVQRKWLKSQITRVSSKAKRVNNSPPQIPSKIPKQANNLSPLLPSGYTAIYLSFSAKSVAWSLPLECHAMCPKYLFWGGRRREISQSAAAKATN